MRHLRELDRLAEDLAVLDRDIGETVVDKPDVKRLLTIAGVNVIVAAGLVAAIGDIHRFSSPQKLVSYFGLNPRVRQSGLGLAQHGRISKIGRAHARAMLVEAAWAAAKAPGIARQSKWKRHDNQEEDLGIAARACLSWRDDIASPFLIVVARRSRACFDGRT